VYELDDAGAGTGAGPFDREPRVVRVDQVRAREPAFRSPSVDAVPKQGGDSTEVVQPLARFELAGQDRHVAALLFDAS